MHAYLGAKYNPFSKLLFLCPSYVYGTGSIFLNVQYLIRLGLNDVNNDTMSSKRLVYVSWLFILPNIPNACWYFDPMRLSNNSENLHNLQIKLLFWGGRLGKTRYIRFNFICLDMITFKNYQITLRPLETIIVENYLNVESHICVKWSFIL